MDYCPNKQNNATSMTRHQPLAGNKYFFGYDGLNVTYISQEKCVSIYLSKGMGTMEQRQNLVQSLLDDVRHIYVGSQTPTMDEHIEKM